MLRPCIHLLVAALLALPVVAGAEKNMVPIIPMEDFFRNPDQTGFQLSPDGVHLAYLAPWEGRLNVHVKRIGSDEVQRITSDTQRDIFGFTWLSNTRVGWIQDKGGDENWRMYAVDLDGGNYLDATPFEGVQAQVIDDLEDDDEHALISLNKRDPRLFDAYRLNVNTGELTLIAENPGSVTGWFTDNAGRLRAAVTSDGVNASVLYRPTEQDSFRTVVTTSFKDAIEPQYFTWDDKQLYVLSNIGRDKKAIFTFDPETGKQLDLIYENPEVDVSALLRSRLRKVITGAVYFTDKRHYHFFDKEREEIQRFIEKELPGYEVVVSSMSRDERKCLVRTFSDRSLGAYYFLDRDKKKLTKLVEVAPWLNEKDLAPMKPVSYKSRDGMTIHGYLTLPVGAKGKKLPVVVNPHGGPWYRDGWGYNPEVQFLANRGYAVLQMNFRGSTGYGKEFWTASFKEWGGTMQDDITDGVNWLVKEGIADPERVGIYGGSYGGYATLAGLTKTPELYACGVDYVGVSSLFTFMEAIPPYWEPFRVMLYEMVGDPEKDKALLEARSPLFHADRIQVPLLVAQGANDPRVNKGESDRMVEALRARGIDVQYMVKDNEGHGFANEENRFDFYRAMEGFLGEHLGGSVEQVPPPGAEH